MELRNFELGVTKVPAEMVCWREFRIPRTQSRFKKRPVIEKQFTIGVSIPFCSTTSPTYHDCEGQCTRAMPSIAPMDAGNTAIADAIHDSLPLGKEKSCTVVAVMWVELKDGRTEADLTGLTRERE